MANLIRPKNIREGEIFNRWLYNRMILKNKNILTATTGPTGSGKSYQDLRKIELWYAYYFKTRVPVDNICFSVKEIFDRINSGEMRKGDILIFEEAGANLGSLDFQNKISKLFNYLLQTFRSMNVGIFFNLPYLTMMNKQARTLLHAHFETAGIDHQRGVSKSKAFFRQVNQASGKVYNKYLRVKVNGAPVPIKRFNFKMPSQYLIDAYEQKKADFLKKITKDFSQQIADIEADEKKKREPKKRKDDD